MIANNETEVDVVVLHAHSGERQAAERRREDPTRWPMFAAWRCNLTGLSQIDNLYFVAYRHEIHVYVPAFPSQALEREPALIIASEPSAPGLQGYLDPRCPHAINSLLVQHLGTEEVVAVVRDDGDVDAFLVRHVRQAIERRAATDNTLPPIADEVRPIFQRNVAMSAWGLAIHSVARIIAVSANTQQVTIFKLGLVVQDHERGAADQLDSNSSHSRDTDVTYRRVNGTCNIPHVAFCNTGSDPEARWLLTTDISGYCRTINLHSMQTVQKFRFGHPSPSRTPGDFDHNNAGWTIMFLDPRSFGAQPSTESALGLYPGEQLPGAQVNKSLWDISATVRHVSNVAKRFVRRREAPRSRRQGPASIGATTQTRSNDDEDMTTYSGEEADDMDTDSTSRDPVHDSLSQGEGGDDDSEDSDVSVYSGEMYSDDETAEGAARPFISSTPRCESFENLCGDLPCPILHASVRNVYLLQPSNHRDPDMSPIPSPTIGFSNVLQQYVQADYGYLNVFERLNMHVQIPSLGIVILASQKGRAVVLALTRISGVATRTPALSDKSKGGGRPIFAMRIEHILPLAEQEPQDRPFAPLAGIAAGPMQGTGHLPEGQRRWRLMLMYLDHTILSYEIRRHQARTSCVNLGDVLV